MNRHLPRRRFLEGVAAALAASSVTRARADEERAPSPALVVLWLNGGPSHVDTFDPKPSSSHKTIKTAIAGVSFAEHLPALAAAAHKLAVVRGMSTKEGNHQRAQYLLHTGYAPNPTVTHPSLGAWTSKRHGDPPGGLPAFVSIGGPSYGGGFLGVEHGPFVVQRAGTSPPNLARPGQVDDFRYLRRRAALDALEARFARESGDPKVEGRRALYGKAYRLMESTGLKAFVVDDEPVATRAAYGDTDFGRGCLVARRLVEAGVRVVEVALDGWDTHENNAERTRALMKTLDPAMSALLGDLGTRGLLGRTTVACFGEFGRTPRVNGNGGRDHHPQAWSALLAGGAIRAGVVHGETDAEGAQVTRDKVTVPDFMATLATSVGLDPGATLMTPVGRPIAVTENGAPVKALLRA